MDTEVLLVDNTGDGQGVECIHEHLEQLLSVFLVALLFKVIELGHDA